ncbi:MAG: hypothetical protein AAAB35_18385 [Phyllobacterium sp.]|uniref:hypothetical protein n=1 Tax=Phyllobacterium sp. TaxID=1871046 RepID=UPI0030F22710
MKTRLFILAISAVLACTSEGLAASQSYPVKFRLGMRSTTLAGDIRGTDTVTYVIEAKPGQEMSIAFRSDHEACTFNVYNPDGDGPVIEAKAIGDGYIGKLPPSGEYAVKVAFMNEAQPATSCRYSITFDISG